MALIPVTNSVLIVLLLRDFVTLDVIPYLGGLPQLPVTSSQQHLMHTHYS